MINARNPACKITGGAGLKLPNLKCDKNGLKRHFFYHPVRVNKELLDEELPCPDTVRNVRKLFEGSSLLRVRSVSKDNIAVNSSTVAMANALDSASKGVQGQQPHQQSVNRPTVNKPMPPVAAACITSNLAVDTSSGNGGHGNGCLETGVTRPKWDAASLSSGVSSGELCSPCSAELGNHVSIYSGDDQQLDDGKCCDPSYVSQVVSAGPCERQLPVKLSLLMGFPFAPHRMYSRKFGPADPQSRITGERCWTSGQAARMASCKISTKIDALLASPSIVLIQRRSKRR